MASEKKSTGRPRQKPDGQKDPLFNFRTDAELIADVDRAIERVGEHERSSDGHRLNRTYVMELLVSHFIEEVDAGRGAGLMDELRASREGWVKRWRQRLRPSSALGLPPDEATGTSKFVDPPSGKRKKGSA